ncbi:hypothetical protein GOBAR_AA08941 [Gossypium barbadense]|uniref:Actin-related protein 5 n=1 Tax=Gossypium barbadense TaxID=3634 RepID=A0A2P5Y802_GOSBA|nr:hypothetical protein GOBAR_AA08941 [Gossypium barbadense]
MPFISKIQRQTDYNRFPPSTPIVIDNGASYFRIGWAGETEPRVIFRNIVQRPRHKSTFGVDAVFSYKYNQLHGICEKDGLAICPGFTTTHVIPFVDGEPVYKGCCRTNIGGYHITDYLKQLLSLKYPHHMCSFWGLIAGETVTIVGDHDPALLKYFDCTRSGPRSAFDSNVVFQFEIMEYPEQIDHPILITECVCNPVHSRSKMAELLFETYGVRSVARFTWEKVEDLKMEHCYIAPDYALEAQLFQKGGKEAEYKTRCWQLPWVPLPTDEPPSEAEIARKAAIRERQGQRLREMAEAKRSSRINELENQLQGLEFLLQQLGQVQEEDIQSFLSETGYASKQEIELTLTKVTQSLRKAKGEPKPEQAENEEKADSCTSDKYPLINVPDNMLTPEQLKEKKRQIFLKITTEGRQRAKQKRVEEELERERKTQQDEERRLENPQLYLEQMHTKYKELYEKVEQRKRLKTNGGHTNGSSSGGVGRGERLNAAQRERMRLLTTAAFDRGKGEDTFELARVSSRLQEIDPTFVPKPEPTASQPATTEVPHVRPLTKEDFQIVLGVERFRCPEILFHPNLVGIDQVGLDEMTGVSIRRLPSKDKALANRLTSSVFMTGGCSLFPVINERLEAGIRMLQPCGSPIKVVRALDPVLDAWRGASLYAANSRFHQQTFSRSDYYEKGEDWLRQYQVRYTL